MSDSTNFTASTSDTDSSSGISFYIDDVDPYTSDTSQSTEENKWWHYEHDRKAWLPRLKTEAKATILSTSTHLTLTQTFENPSRYRLIKNSVYSFPLYPHATIVSLECKFRDKILVGKVEPKSKARKIYTEAINLRQNAVLMEEVTPEIFTVELGNIAPMEKVEVVIGIISEIKHDPDHDSVRFILPTAIAPRYGPIPFGIATNTATASLNIEIGILMPEEIRAITNPNQPMTIIYGELPGETKSKESNPTDAKKATVRLVKDSEGVLAADFVLMIQVKKFAKSMPPFALIEPHPQKSGNMALMVSLVPRVSLPLPDAKSEIIFIVDLSGSMEDKIPKLRSALEVFLKSLPLGVFFNICFFGTSQRLLFGGGSRKYSAETLNMALDQTRTLKADMGGTELLEALRVSLFSKSEDIKTTEVIVLTDGEVWRPDDTFDFIRHRRTQDADYGDQLRVFALGIGDHVSYHLVEGMATAGGGFSVFVGNNEAFGDKIVRMLKAALSAKISNLEVEVEFEDGHGYLPAATIQAVSLPKDSKEDGFIPQSLWSTRKEQKTAISLMDSDSDETDEDEAIKSAEPIKLPDESSENRYSHLRDLVLPNPLRSPNSLEHMFPHQRTVIFLLFEQDPDALISAAKAVLIKTKLSTGETLAPLSIPITMAEFPQNFGNSTMIHCLAARSIIKDMEQGRSWLETGNYGIDRTSEFFGDYIAREAERLGMEWGIVSKWTSLVAVELTPVASVVKEQCSKITELADESTRDSALDSGTSLDREISARTCPSISNINDTNEGDNGVLPSLGSNPAESYSSNILKIQENEGQEAHLNPKRDTVVIGRQGPGFTSTTPATTSLAPQDAASSTPFSDSDVFQDPTTLLAAIGLSGFTVTDTHKVYGASTDGLDYNPRSTPKRRPARVGLRPVTNDARIAATRRSIDGCASRFIYSDSLLERLRSKPPPIPTSSANYDSETSDEEVFAISRKLMRSALQKRRLSRHRIVAFECGSNLESEGPVMPPVVDEDGPAQEHAKADAVLFQTACPDRPDLASWVRETGPLTEDGRVHSLNEKSPEPREKTPEPEEPEAISLAYMGGEDEKKSPVSTSNSADVETSDALDAQGESDANHFSNCRSRAKRAVSIPEYEELGREDLQLVGNLDSPLEGTGMALRPQPFEFRKSQSVSFQPFKAPVVPTYRYAPSSIETPTPPSQPPPVPEPPSRFESSFYQRRMCLGRPRSPYSPPLPSAISGSDGKDAPASHDIGSADSYQKEILADHQMELMVLEAPKKRRLLRARAKQDNLHQGVCGSLSSDKQVEPESKEEYQAAVPAVVCELGLSQDFGIEYNDHPDIPRGGASATDGEILGASYAPLSTEDDERCHISDSCIVSGNEKDGPNGSDSSKSDKSELVDRIIALQHFDGAFRLSEKDIMPLTQLVFRLTGRIIQLVNNSVSDTEEIIKILIEYCVEWEGTWSLVVEKARVWLKSMKGGTEDTSISGRP